MYIKNYLLFIIILIITINDCIGQSNLYINDDLEGYPNTQLLGENDYGIDYYPVVDNLKMHFRCYQNAEIQNNSGEFILFDSGFPFFSTSFGNVLEKLVEGDTMTVMGISNACFIDRYGYGFSSLSPKPIGSQEFAKKLKKSIEQIPTLKNKKLIYVGWSYGGLNGQVFAMMYPKMVKGFLAIDSTDVNIIFDQKWQDISNMTQTLAFALSIPNYQFSYLCDQSQIQMEYGWIPNSVSLPNSCIKISQDIMKLPNQNNIKVIGQELSTLLDNAFSLIEDFSRANDIQKPFGDLPMVVLTAQANGYEWIQRQNNLSKLSRNSYQIIVDSDHYIPIYKPDYVVVELYKLISMSNRNLNLNNINNNNKHYRF